MKLVTLVSNNVGVDTYLELRKAVNFKPLSGTDRPAKIIHPISKGSDTRFKNRRQKCGSYSQQPGSEKTKDSGTRIINHFTKEELQYDTK